MARNMKTTSGGFPLINSTTTLDELLFAVKAVPRVLPPYPTGPAYAHPAVATCLHAYSSVLRAGNEAGKSKFECASDARKAWNHAMPPLVGYENIRDFVACVTQGTLIGAIEPEDATRLLYAAQVANTILKTLPRAPDPPPPASEEPLPEQNEPLSAPAAPPPARRKHRRNNKLASKGL